MKAMHRLIVTSATYKTVEPVTAEHRARDSETACTPSGSNAHAVLLLRDWALAASGLLVNRTGGPPFTRTSRTPSGKRWRSPRNAILRILHPSESIFIDAACNVLARTVNPANMFDTSNRRLSSAIDRNQFTAARADDAQRSHVGRGGADAGGTKRAGVFGSGRD